MDHPFAMRCGQASGNLNGVIDRSPDANRAAEQSLPKGLPFEQLFNYVGLALVCADIVDGNEIRVVESARCARLLLEAHEPLAVCCELRRKHFDCHLSTDSRIARTIDLPHSARPDRCDDLVRTEAAAGRESHERREACGGLSQRPQGTANPAATLG